MDEYIGLPPDAPQRFGTLLRKALFGLVGLGATNYLSPGEAGPAQEATRYAALLAEAPIDLVCMGVGENGHIAFNDPPADLEDPLLVRKVELDEACRRQQVNDGCFATLEAVPRQALTMTVSALMSGRHLVCVVPGRSKAVAVRAMLECPVSGVCPASALRRHPNCSLYLDADSASLWLR
jgi:glucosamine-6-phosphate deaminase